MPRPNSCQHLTAARLPRPGLKPLVHSEMRDVIPLADRVAFVELNRGKRAAIPAARTRGLAAGEATDVGRTGTKA